MKGLHGKTVVAPLKTIVTTRGGEEWGKGFDLAETQGTLRTA